MTEDAHAKPMDIAKSAVDDQQQAEWTQLVCHECQCKTDVIVVLNDRHLCTECVLVAVEAAGLTLDEAITGRRR